MIQQMFKSTAIENNFQLKYKMWYFIFRKVEK